MFRSRWVFSITLPALIFHHLGMIADILRLVGEVVGIDADAVATDQTGTKGQKVPLGARRLQHFLGVDAEAMEDQGQLVDQRDVQIALGVLDHLGRLGHPDRTGPAGAGTDDRSIKPVDERSDLGRRAGRDLHDVRQSVLLVTGIDALGAVAHEKIPVEGQTGRLLEHRHANLFGGTGIDRRFVDHHVALGQLGADRAAGRLQRMEIRALVVVDRGRHRDDIGVAGHQRFRFGGERQMPCVRKHLCAGLPRGIDAIPQLPDPLGVDVETDRLCLLAKFHGKRQADIAKPDDCQSNVLDRIDRLQMMFSCSRSTSEHSPTLVIAADLVALTESWCP